MKKYLAILGFLAFSAPAFATPPLPSTPFDFQEYKGPCRATIKVLSSTPTVLVSGYQGTSAAFTMATLTTAAPTAFFNGMADRMTASASGGGAEIKWCCALEP